MKWQKIFLSRDEWTLVKIYIIWLLGLLFIGQIGIWITVPTTCFRLTILERLANWDGGHFLTIIKDGYNNSYSLAFFPLFPFITRLISLGLFPLMVGLLINWIASGVGAVFLYKLIKRDFDQRSALNTVVLNLFFPLSFFLIAFYSEALFICLSVGAFYFFQKKQIELSALLAGLVSLTRFSGVAVILVLAYEAYKTKQNWQLFLLSFFGVGSFWFYAWSKSGNFFQILNSEANWQRLVSLPGSSIYSAIRVLAAEGVSFDSFGLLTQLLAVGLVVGISVYLYRRLPRIYGNYLLVSLIIPLSTSTFLSFPRFLVVIFPFFLGIALVMKPKWRPIYLSISSILLLSMFQLFLAGVWIS